MPGTKFDNKLNLIEIYSHFFYSRRNVSPMKTGTFWERLSGCDFFGDRSLNWSVSAGWNCIYIEAESWHIVAPSPFFLPAGKVLHSRSPKLVLELHETRGIPRNSIQFQPDFWAEEIYGNFPIAREEWSVVREASLHNGIIAYGNGAKFESVIAPHDEISGAHFEKKSIFVNIDRINLKQSVVKRKWSSILGIKWNNLII